MVCSKVAKVIKPRNVYLDEDVRNIACDKKKSWLDLLSKKANERIQSNERDCKRGSERVEKEEKRSEKNERVSDQQV